MKMEIEVTEEFVEKCKTAIEQLKKEQNIDYEGRVGAYIEESLLGLSQIIYQQAKVIKELEEKDTPPEQINEKIDESNPMYM